MKLQDFLMTIGVLWLQNEDKNGGRKNGEREKDGLEEKVRM